MAGQNRHLRGDMNEILVDVRGNVVVESGDFMVHNDTAGMISNNGTVADGIPADAYAYPFNDVENGSSSQGTLNALCYVNFIGVAMDGSPSGVTEKITVATAGVFRYPMVGGSGGVTVGSLVSATSPATGTPASVQTVARINTTPGTTAYLGRIVKTESGATYVDFEIGTIYNGLKS